MNHSRGPFFCACWTELPGSVPYVAADSPGAVRPLVRPRWWPVRALCPYGGTTAETRKSSAGTDCGPIRKVGFRLPVSSAWLWEAACQAPGRPLHATAIERILKELETAATESGASLRNFLRPAMRVSIECAQAAMAVRVLRPLGPPGSVPRCANSLLISAIGRGASRRPNPCRWAISLVPHDDPLMAGA